MGGILNRFLDHKSVSEKEQQSANLECQEKNRKKNNKKQANAFLNEELRKIKG